MKIIAISALLLLTACKKDPHQYVVFEFDALGNISSIHNRSSLIVTNLTLDPIDSLAGHRIHLDVLRPWVVNTTK